MVQVPEGRDQVVKPERVLVLAKSMRVRWRQLDARLQGGVTSLDDLMRIDLHYITRRAARALLLLVYTGDNQGSIACMAKMMGKGDILTAESGA